MPKKKEEKIDFLELINQVHNYDLNPASREIYLHSHYLSGDDEGGIEYRMANQFIKNLHLLNKQSSDSILVHLQSPGGDWVHGMAMFDAIQFSVSKVAMLAYGEVSSMSGVLFQSACNRVMMPSCELMIHHGFLSLEGVSNTVQSNALWNRKIDEKMLKIYASRAVNGPYFSSKDMNENAVAKFIDKKIKKFGDWSLTAEEAVYYGFCDGVYGQEGFETSDKILNC